MPGQRALADVPERAREVGGELRGRVTDIVGEVSHRVADATSAMPDRATARRAGIGVLEIAQAVLGVVIAVPRMITRALTIARALTERAEVLAERGHELSQRAREVAHAVEPSRRDRRRHRLGAVGLVAAGFGAGFAAGWFAAERRARAEREHDAEQARAHAAMVRASDLAADDPETAGGERGTRRLTPVEQPRTADGPDGR